nr:hypothetical protein [Brucella anthropi]
MPQNTVSTSQTDSAASAEVAGERMTVENAIASASQTPAYPSSQPGGHRPARPREVRCEDRRALTGNGVSLSSCKPSYP